MTKEPLDIDEAQGPSKEKERFSNVRFYLELVPLLLLSLAVFLQYQQSPYWKYVLMAGGILTGAIYLLFSRFIFKAEKQNLYEVLLSVGSGIVIALGIAGIIFQQMMKDGAEFLILCALYGTLLLIGLTLISFVLNMKDQQAARFHRSLLARLLIFIAIVLSLTV